MRSVRALSSVKAELRALLKREGKTGYRLAREMGWHPPQMARVLDPAYASRIDQIEAVAAALGRQVKIKLVRL